MYVARRKGRRYRRSQLLQWGRACGTCLLVGNAQKPATSANGCTCALQLDGSFVEGELPGPPRERRLRRNVADQVVAILIVKHASDPPAQVICARNHEASRFMRQIIQTVPCISISNRDMPKSKEFGALLHSEPESIV